MTKFILIQARDLDIFLFLYNHKVATVKQIQNKFFPNCSYQAAQRRLSYLEQYGFISSVRHLETTHSVYYANKKSVEHLIQKGIVSENAIPVRVNLYTLDHDISISDTVIALDTLPVIHNINSENQIARSQMPHLNMKVPDITFSIDNGEIYNYAIEIELTKKTKERYRMIFANYYFKHDIDAVLYLTKDESIIKYIIPNEKLISQDKCKKVYFATLQSFLENPMECSFVNTSGQKYALKNMYRNIDRPCGVKGIPLGVTKGEKRNAL